MAWYYSVNADHFRQWEPVRESGYYSEASLYARLSDYEEKHRTGTAAHFIGLDEEELIAHCSITNIVYGAFRAGYMGYGVSKMFEGTGAMTKVCMAAIEHTFVQLELNRIMTNHMPCNERSKNLLKGLVFSEERLTKKYLKINGVWEDHALTSLVNPENS